MNNNELIGIGLAKLKPEGRCVLLDDEDLNILAHVVCNLKNRIADKNERIARSKLNKMVRNW